MHTPARPWPLARLLSVVFIAGGLAAASTTAVEGQVPVERVTGKHLEIVRDNQFISVRQGDRLLLEYRYGGVSHKPYVTQLTSPSGVNVLRDAPADHLHHHGLMFAWRVNDVNFWEEVAGSGREVHRQWRALRIATVAAGDESDDEFTERAVLHEQLLWTAPTGDVLLAEERVLTVPVAAEGEPCVITWQSSFTVSADVADVVISGTNYNGLGVRFIESMDDGGWFQNNAGGSGVAGTSEQPAKWCAYTAVAADDHPVTVAMFDARDNSRHPARWFTMDQPFAYLAATQGLHIEPLHVPAGGQLTLRYGVGVFDGATDHEVIDETYTHWQQLSPESHHGTD